jgi:hypothetical protein
VRREFLPGVGSLTPNHAPGLALFGDVFLTGRSRNSIGRKTTVTSVNSGSMLLHCGLVMLRNIAPSGQSDLCRIEAEHLHEIPTLVGEPNERRHEYYLRGTRGLYIQSLRELGADEYLANANIWYSEPWRVLESLATVRFSEEVK